MSGKDMSKALLFAVLTCAVGAHALAAGDQPAASVEQSYQGKSLFGEDLYTKRNSNLNVAQPAVLTRAANEAQAAFDKEITPDTATWYGRLLAYQGLMKEAIAVYDAGLKRFPDSAKLLRHRAHRYFSLRRFDESIKDGLKAAQLYVGKPLEREKLGPDYFPSTADVVQFYLYYHLGQAYFAKHEFDTAAHWFNKSGEVAFGVESVADYTAGVYWGYLSLARGQHYSDAKALLDRYQYTLQDLRDNAEANYYFDGIQLFKGHRAPDSFFNNVDSGKPFSTADGVAASSSYSLANYYIARGEVASAKDWLRRSIKVDSWGYFARIQAEADWVHLFGSERP
jgi:hypothetical protein